MGRCRKSVHTPQQGEQTTLALVSIEVSSFDFCCHWQQNLMMQDVQIAIGAGVPTFWHVHAAARLLLAASAGQILLEAPVMEAVLKQWNGEAFHLASASKNSSFSNPKASLGAAVVESGNLVLPELVGSAEDDVTATPRIKTPPQLRVMEATGNSFPPEGSGFEVDSSGGILPSQGMQLSNSQVGDSEGVKSWRPRIPQSGKRCA